MCGILQVKGRLQTRLAELEPIPELLKTTELRLQDANEKLLAYEKRNTDNTKLIAELTAKVSISLQAHKFSFVFVAGCLSQEGDHVFPFENMNFFIGIQQHVFSLLTSRIAVNYYVLQLLTSGWQVYAIINSLIAIIDLL